MTFHTHDKCQRCWDHLLAQLCSWQNKHFLWRGQHGQTLLEHVVQFITSTLAERYSNMDSTNSSFVAEGESIEMDIIIVAVYGLITILGVALNGLTIAVVTTGRSISEESSLQILNLAVADLLSSLLYPAVVLIIKFQLPFHAASFWCTSLILVDTTVFYASPLWNVTISIEKLVAVYFPLHMLTYKRKQKIIVATIVWLVAAIAQLDVILYARVSWDRDLDVPLCAIRNPLKTENIQLYDTFLALRFITPAVIIVTMYSLIGIKIFFRKSIGEMRWRTTLQARKERFKVSY